MKKLFWYLWTAAGLAIVAFLLTVLCAHIILLTSPAGDAASPSGKTGFSVLGLALFFFVVMVPSTYYLMLVGVIKKMSFEELLKFNLTKQKDFVIVSVLAIVLGAGVFLVLAKIFP
jgi:hypothetical protein